MNASTILADLGIAQAAQAGDIAVHSPISGELIGRVASNTVADVDAALANAQQAFNAWRNVPAPRRGERSKPARSFRKVWAKCRK
jgi:aldehyde dehydrogenase (NAD+)